MPGLERYLYTLCRGNYEAVHDCLQETVIRVLKSSEGYRGEASYRTWVYQIGRNVAIDSFRRWKRRREREFSTETDGFSELPFRTGQNPEDLMLRNFEQKLVLDALMGLPGKYRSCLYLKEIEGLGLKEIGQLLGVPEGTIKSRLFHARSKFARNYSRLANGKPRGGKSEN